MITEHKIVLKDRITSHMTDEEFFWFCQENKDLRIERNENLEIIIMAPVGTFGGYKSGEAFGQLLLWNKKSKTGKVFDSSTGFTLPNRAMLSPDASWISNERWATVPKQEYHRFAHVCPEFVIEVRSKNDTLEDLKAKMNVWISNGAQLAWLIDPFEKQVYIYRISKDIIVLNGFTEHLKAEAPVLGFELDLNALLDN